MLSNRKTKLTAKPVLVLDLYESIRKQPSAATNPDIQLGFEISWSVTKGLETGITSGKAVLSFSVKPLFIVARILTILRKPSIVKYFLHLTNSKACLKSW